MSSLSIKACLVLFSVSVFGASLSYGACRQDSYPDYLTCKITRNAQGKFYEDTLTIDSRPDRIPTGQKQSMLFGLYEVDEYRLETTKTAKITFDSRDIVTPDRIVVVTQYLDRRIIEVKVVDGDSRIIDEEEGEFEFSYGGIGVFQKEADSRYPNVSMAFNDGSLNVTFFISCYQEYKSHTSCI
ncbi:MAG: hypothetical protein AB1540_09120 [Bdellovibrionota bacterium]